MVINKSQLRQKILYERNNLSYEFVKGKSDIIINILLNLELVQKSEAIMCYMDFKNEVMTGNLIKYCLNEKKTVVLPVVSKLQDGNAIMYAACINDLNTDVEVQSFGMFQPNQKCRTVQSNDIDIVIVPGVAFDTNRNRLGFGKGYYDRFLSSLRADVLKIGIAFDFQVVNELPYEKHDIKMDMIITEKQIIR